MNEGESRQKHNPREWLARHRKFCDLMAISWGTDHGFPWQQRRLLGQYGAGVVKAEFMRPGSQRELRPMIYRLAQLKLAPYLKWLKLAKRSHQQISLHRTEEMEHRKLTEKGKGERKGKEVLYSYLTLNEYKEKAQTLFSKYFYSLVGIPLFNGIY